MRVRSRIGESLFENVFPCESESEFVPFVLDSCSRLWGNRANGGDICGVGNSQYAF